MNIQSLPINHYLFADWRSFVSSPSSATPNKPSQFTKPLFLLPIRLHFFLPRAYILPPSDLLLPLCGFFPNNQLALSWHFWARLIYDEKMPTFAGEAMVLNDTTRAGGRGLLAFFRFCPCPNLNDTMAVRFLCPFPFQNTLLYRTPHPRRPRDLPF